VACQDVTVVAYLPRLCGSRWEGHLVLRHGTPLPVGETYTVEIDGVTPFRARITGEADPEGVVAFDSRSPTPVRTIDMLPPYS